MGKNKYFEEDGIVYELSPQEDFAYIQDYIDKYGVYPHPDEYYQEMMSEDKYKEYIKNKSQDQTDSEKIDFSAIKKDMAKGKLKSSAMNIKNLEYIQGRLIDAGFSKTQRTAILGSIIYESGGNIGQHGNHPWYGLIGWTGSRFKDPNTGERILPETLEGQTEYLINELINGDNKVWHHGGVGSGYRSYTDAINAFNTSDDIKSVANAITRGFVRPKDSSTRINAIVALDNYYE